MADKINAAGYETKPWWPYVRELMEGGGSVTVEQLNVTENGTYTAEAGKAYSPVVVNVPSGSSDFSTATITFHLTYPEGVTPVGERFQLYFTYPSESSEYNGSITIESGIAQIILYENYVEIRNIQAMSTNDEFLSPTNVVLSGNIEYDEEGFYKVTGDGTFTADMVIDQ